MSIVRSTRGRFGIHIGVVHLKPHHLQLVLDVAREKELQPIETFGKEIESIATIDVPCDFLLQVRYVGAPAFPVDEVGSGVARSFCRGDDRRAIMKGDVVQLEGNVIAFQDVPDRNTEQQPEKLNQREHVGYMNEGVKENKIGEEATPCLRIECGHRMWSVFY